jgi:hypothetical protein
MKALAPEPLLPLQAPSIITAIDEIRETFVSVARVN